MGEFHEIAGYRLVGELGTGARSAIYSVRDKNNKPFAIKRVVKNTPSDQRYLDQVVSEHEVASQFDCELLRRSYKLIKQRNFIRTSEVLVLMELIEGKTLEQAAPKSMADLAEVFRQAARGLAVMHQGGYVHADIKPNNIMVTQDGRVKIIDFGQSCKIGTIKQRIQGTPDYIAPEQVQRRMITPQTDIFNLGATMYWLTTGKHIPTLIPKGQPGMTLSSDMISARSPEELNPDTPPALSRLIMDCLEADPANRPKSMTAVADRLEIAAAQSTRRPSETARPRSAGDARAKGNVGSPRGGADANGGEGDGDAEPTEGDTVDLATAEHRREAG